MAAGRGQYKNPDKIGFAESGKSPNWDPFAKHIVLALYLLGDFQGSFHMAKHKDSVSKLLTKRWLILKSDKQ